MPSERQAPIIRGSSKTSHRAVSVAVPAGRYSCSMLLMETDSLWSGLIAATPVRHPLQEEVDLVMPGVPLDEGMIANLRRLGVQSMWVNWPSLDFLDDIVDMEAERLRRDVFLALKRDFESCQALTVGITQYMRYRDMVGRLIAQLVGHEGHSASAQTAGLYDQAQDIFSHSANVTYLSLTLGLRMENYIARQRIHSGSRDLTNLGVGAMLHDIGKLQLPSTQALHEPLRTAPTPAYAEHPRKGYAMIRARVSPTARAVVLHHHQRYDGSGFPDLASLTGNRRRGALRGSDIHVFARVVAVCDAFDNLCRGPSGEVRPVVAALHDLLRPDLVGRFDPVILRGLLSHVPPLALGSHVTLNDGTAAAVIAMNRNQPCRPIVRRLKCDDALQRDVDLSGETELHISTQLGMKVEKWLFDLPACLTPKGQGAAAE